MLFAQLPAPGQHRECSNNWRRFEGSTKAELRTFLANKRTARRIFKASARRGVPEKLVSQRHPRLLAKNHRLRVAADVLDCGGRGAATWITWHDKTAASESCRLASRVAGALCGRVRGAVRRPCGRADEVIE